ncbi:DNA mismatch repair protein MutS [Spirochaeta lutea]|uniref:DNA mismatch repair protein MutS n=1 Tax=Spirochaeta lutea TaxID=1480694 RepID=A0A098R1H2_9SPIO|nr:DNA mismatch repair protein MutS [Spirochaeta lutea]KGE73980.1 hypothetical protein DC28_02055 [Spirochaeta lutea]
MSDSTPMMQQYTQIKSKHRDAIVFFRLGDFYEMFHKDAQEASKILGLTLTKRNGIPMCGIPYHASGAYVGRLLQAGKKIAVCEQTKLPEGGKGIAEREVVEVLTPGTVMEEDMLPGENNNYLVALSSPAPDYSDPLQQVYSFAALDVSTGELFLTSYSGPSAAAFLRREIYRYNPPEIVVQESMLEQVSEIAQYLKDSPEILLNRYPDWYFDSRTAAQRLRDLLGVAGLQSFGLAPDSPELHSASVLIDYAEDVTKHRISFLRELQVYKEHDAVSIDESSQKNLELTRNMRDGTRKYTLLDVIDQTQTPMGSRLLQRWLLRPLNSAPAILERQARVRGFYHSQLILSKAAELLGSIRDLDRLAARISLDKGHAKDLLSLGTSLSLSIELLDLLSGANLGGGVPEHSRQGLQEITALIENAIIENPSILLTEGRLIRPGYSPEVDEIRSLKENSRETLESYLSQERDQSGIQNLKLKYNKIIGYHLEVSKGQVSKVPEHFIRRQSLVNAERYTTERLGELESKITLASDRLIELERQCFIQVRQQVRQRVQDILEVSKLVAETDCIQSLARVATLRGYVAPELVEEVLLDIEGGRHPVVEAHLSHGEFVPNSLELSSKKGSTSGRFALITGPNMAGKSTYLRQNALITILAQIGSFVPADRAKIGICDKVFCRVGASDNLARGESTFLVEMNETALILRTATERSLIIMDEVGRGTSTQDGLSIAWAVSEYVLNTIKARTLFATHYHELTELSHPNLQNLSLQVDDEDGEIVFLRRVVPKASSNSYGIHVAQLAGIPRMVIERAQELLNHFDVPAFNPGKPGKQGSKPQKRLFDPLEEISLELKNIDIGTTTPLQALTILARFQESLKK